MYDTRVKVDMYLLQHFARTLPSYPLEIQETYGKPQEQKMVKIFVELLNDHVLIGIAGAYFEN